MIARLAAIALLLASPVYAEQQTAVGLEGGECNIIPDSIQADCLFSKYREWDLKMRDAIKHDKITTEYNIDAHPDYAGEQKRQLDGIDKSQDRWLQYRQRTCGDYARAISASARVKVYDCMLRVTAARTYELQQMLEK